MRETTVVAGGVVLLGALICFCIYASIVNEREWEAFKVAHHCKLVAETSGTSAPSSGFDSKGRVTFGTVYIPGSESWACDDGITHTRSK